MSAVGLREVGKIRAIVIAAILATLTLQPMTT
jgi:hypothetical protein